MTPASKDDRERITGHCRRNYRVVLGLIDLCFYYSTLTRGLREIGVDAHLINLGSPTPDYLVNWNNSDPIRRFVASYEVFHATRDRPRLSLTRLLPTAGLLLHRAILVIWILATVDVVILKSGESLFANKFDVRLFKLFRKVVIFIYHGSDSRPPYLNAFYADKPVELLRERTLKTKQAVMRNKGFADYVVENPLSAHFQTTNRCCMYQILGNPIDERRLKSAFEEGIRRKWTLKDIDERSIRVLHAPSNAALKGTDKIRECIVRLKTEGFKIDYVEISGVSNAKVIEEIAKSDLVIDELYSDMHGATFAMESLAVGRLVVVGGYGRNQLDAFVPSDFVPPTEYCEPEGLFDVMRQLLRNVELIETRAGCGREFMAGIGSSASAARRLLQLAGGKAPDSWFFSPADVRYVGGVAGSANKIGINISRLVDAYGEQALMVEDKPLFKAAALDCASHVRADLGAQ